MGRFAKLQAFACKAEEEGHPSGPHRPPQPCHGAPATPPAARRPSMVWNAGRPGARARARALPSSRPALSLTLLAAGLLALWTQAPGSLARSCARSWSSRAPTSACEQPAPCLPGFATPCAARCGLRFGKASNVSPGRQAQGGHRVCSMRWLLWGPASMRACCPVIGSLPALLLGGGALVEPRFCMLALPPRHPEGAHIAWCSLVGSAFAAPCLAFACWAGEHAWSPPCLA